MNHGGTKREGGTCEEKFLRYPILSIFRILVCSTICTREVASVAHTLQHCATIKPQTSEARKKRRERPHFFWNNSMRRATVNSSLCYGQTLRSY
jgi:hypothetical protein